MTHEELRKELAHRAAKILGDPELRARSIDTDTLDWVAQRLLEERFEFLPHYKNETRELIKHYLGATAPWRDYEYLPRLLEVES